MTELQKILASEARKPALLPTKVGSLIQDGEFLALDELDRRHVARTNTLVESAAQSAYSRAIKLAQAIIEAQQGEGKHEDHLRLKVGDYVVFTDYAGVMRQGQLTEIDSFGYAFVNVRSRVQGLKLGGYVNMRAPRDSLQLI